MCISLQSAFTLNIRFVYELTFPLKEDPSTILYKSIKFTCNNWMINYPILSHIDPHKFFLINKILSVSYL